MRRMARRIRHGRDSVRDKWKRLSAFHRFAVGLTVSILMVWVVRVQALDRMQANLVEIQEELRKSEAPVVVPPMRQDGEIQETQLLLENLETALAEVRRDRVLVLQERLPLRSWQKQEAIARLGDMVSESGLRVLAMHELEVLAPSTLTFSDHHFTLTGPFRSALQFFQRVQAFPHPCTIDRITLGLEEADNGMRPPGTGVLLTMTFRIRLYYYDAPIGD